MPKRKQAPEPIEVPEILDPEFEATKLIKREKKKVARKFHWEIPKAMGDAAWTAYLLFAVGRHEEALAICDFLDRDKEASPPGNKLWYSLRRILLLKSHLCRQIGRADDALLCTTRIEERGGYLDYTVTDPESHVALDQCRGSFADPVNDSHETTWRVNLLIALLFVIELRHHRGISAVPWEKELEENCERLRELIK